MRRRQKILLLACFLIAVSAALFSIISSHRQNNYDPSETITDSASQPKVVITNANDYKTWFDTSRIPDVETAIYARVKQYDEFPKSRYSAHIRKDSLHTTYNPYNGSDGPSQVPTVSFLVDIPSASESYKVTFSGGDGYPYNILYVLCPDSNQLVYGDFGCKDMGQ